MKVDRNQLVGAVVDLDPVRGSRVYGGIPLRLELAARFAAGDLSNQYSPLRQDGTDSFCKYCLVLADALIESHNETCGENSSGE